MTSSGGLPTGDQAVCVKQCSLCGEIKPETEFYVHDKGASNSRRNRYCKDCDRRRPRNRTEARIIRTRARNRATAELVKRHKAEFTSLLNEHTDHATYEAMLLREVDRASHDGGITTLLPGQRREQQSTLDRIRNVFAEVGRCTSCSSLHSHGHACPSCGTPPVPAAERDADALVGCTCPHMPRMHLEDGCRVRSCDCAGYPAESAA